MHNSIYLLLFFSFTVNCVYSMESMEQYQYFPTPPAHPQTQLPVYQVPPPPPAPPVSSTNHFGNNANLQSPQSFARFSVNLANPAAPYNYRSETERTLCPKKQNKKKRKLTTKEAAITLVSIKRPKKKRKKLAKKRMYTPTCMFTYKCNLCKKKFSKTSKSIIEYELRRHFSSQRCGLPKDRIKYELKKIKKPEKILQFYLRCPFSNNCKDLSSKKDNQFQGSLRKHLQSKIHKDNPEVKQFAADDNALINYIDNNIEISIFHNIQPFFTQTL